MNSATESRRRAAQGRDVALRRLRRATQVSVVLTLAAGAGFAALAAGSTRAKKVIHTSARPVVAKRPSPLVTAPAPPLVPVQGAQQTGGPTPTPAPAPAPPASAPAQSYAPPVVVSGGS